MIGTRLSYICIAVDKHINNWIKTEFTKVDSGRRRHKFHNLLLLRLSSPLLLSLFSQSCIVYRFFLYILFPERVLKRH